MIHDLTTASPALLRSPHTNTMYRSFALYEMKSIE